MSWGSVPLPGEVRASPLVPGLGRGPPVPARPPPHFVGQPFGKYLTILSNLPVETQVKI